MQDSDDYFTDDFILDDTALAVLDEEEHKYTLSTQNTALSRVSPPPKRLKTEAGWRPGPNSRRAETMDDLDDLPEISVQGDGSYGLHARHAAAASNRPSNIAVRALNGAQQSTSVNRHVLTRTASSSSPTGLQRRSPGANPRVPQHQTCRSVPSSRSPSIPPVAPSQSLHGGPSLKSMSKEDVSDVGAQVDALHRQMEELRRENERIQSALRDAMSVRMAKEGEVSVLRKNMEKTAQDHAVQVAKLRAAREQADIKQAQMQKEVKEEMERLRTQFTFKQHELETSIRRPQWSARLKRTSTEAPPTPVDIPAQMRGWNAYSDMRVAGPSSFVHSTPRRPQSGTLVKESPKTLQKRAHISADSPKKSAKLPGFYNSFANETPIRSTQNRKVNNRDMSDIREGDRKGKGRASVFDDRSQFSSTGPPPPSPPSSPSRGRTVTHIEPPSDDILAYAVDNGNIVDDNPDMFDIDMMDDNADESMAEELDEIRSPNWQEELHRMILTHTAQTCTVATFQTLMKAPSEALMPATSLEAYSNACTRILEVLAAPSYCIDWESALYAVAKSLTDMAHLLDVAGLISPLTALLSLLTNLSYSLPSFSSFLLSPFEEYPDEGSPSKILVVLCNVIHNHFAPTSTTIQSNVGEAVRSLATSTIDLMESLCWNIPEDLEGQLALIPRSPRVLSTLLDAAQSLWLLGRSVRLLVLLSSRANLFRSLLSYPDPEISSGEAAKEFTKIPHIERLCSILVDTSLQGTDAQILKDSILTFFTMLSVAHTDALTILLESLTLIPSLVLYLTYLTTPFREDDIKLMASPSTITSSIRAISRTVVLLNYLVFSTEPTCNLRQKLHHAPHRQFNGISYMFIVTFGTLSYGDPPEWISNKDRIELEQTTEMARDLLDLVVEGPEGDSIYAAYQSDVDDGSVTDDEEMEARLLDTNEV